MGRFEGKGLVFGLAGAALLAGAVAIIYDRKPTEPDLTSSVLEQVVEGVHRSTPVTGLARDDVRLSGLKVEDVGDVYWLTGTIEIRRREFEPFKDVKISPTGWFKTKFTSEGELKREEVLNAFGRPTKRSVWHSRWVEVKPAGFWAKAMALWDSEKPGAEVIFDGWMESLRTILDPSDPTMVTVQETLNEDQIVWLLTARELRKAGKTKEAKRALSRADLELGDHEWGVRARQEARWQREGSP